MIPLICILHSGLIIELNALCGVHQGWDLALSRKKGLSGISVPHLDFTAYESGYLEKNPFKVCQVILMSGHLQMTPLSVFCPLLNMILITNVFFWYPCR